MYGKVESNILDALPRLQIDKELHVNDLNQWDQSASVSITGTTLAPNLYHSSSLLIAQLLGPYSSTPTSTLHQFLVSSPPVTILALNTFRNVTQTSTTGPRDENWLHREVRVLGSWFTNFD